MHLLSLMHLETPGGLRWVPLIVAGLKAFLAIHNYMGLRRQPNINMYWEKEGFIFYCPLISDIMTIDRFKQLKHCMHLSNVENFAHIRRDDPKYNKTRQVRWLVNDIKHACEHKWRLEKHVTIDEMMVRYKGIVLTFFILYFAYYVSYKFKCFALHRGTIAIRFWKNFFFIALKLSFHSIRFIFCMMDLYLGFEVLLYSN